jgi:hypothetical protein
MTGDQQRNGPARKRPVESDAIEWKDYPQIAPGEYPAYCKWGKRYRDRGYRRWTCLLRWDVFTEDLQRVIACVPWFLSLGAGDKPLASRRVSISSSGLVRTAGRQRAGIGYPQTSSFIGWPASR